LLRKAQHLNDSGPALEVLLTLTKSA